MNLIHKIKKVLTNKEIISYLVVGMGTTLINIVTFNVLLNINIDYKVSNLIALVIAKLFAYVANKCCVFRSKTENIIALIKEFFRYFIARGFTGIIDYFGLIFMVEILQISSVVSKYIIQSIVIILNYFLGKYKVFNKGGTYK